MVEAVIKKIFKDQNTTEDIYILSIKINDKIFNIDLTKREFEELSQSLYSIYRNNIIEE
jgi:hypothetical protein